MPLPFAAILPAIKGLVAGGAAAAPAAGATKAAAGGGKLAAGAKKVAAPTQKLAGKVKDDPKGTAAGALQGLSGGTKHAAETAARIAENPLGVPQMTWEELYAGRGGV